MGFGALHKSLREQHLHFVNFSVLAAALIDADLLEFAAPEVADVVDGRQKSRDNCKEFGKADTEKTMDSISRHRFAISIIQSTTTAKSSRLRRNVFTNNCLISCQTFFGTNFCVGLSVF